MKPGLEQRLKDKARELGFDACGITRPQLPAAEVQGLERFVAQGWHGSMGWLADTLQRRRDPLALMPAARSAIVCAMSHAPPDDLDPLARVADAHLANISIYALRRDYHDVIKGKLKHLAQWLHAHTGAEMKVFVDTAPLMERPLAVQAGIGWKGKHTCVLSRHLGNWLFLGVVLTSAELTPDAPARAHCGSCTRCIDICPTRAIVAPGQLDARCCISYLTIEHHGPIPRRLRPLMGNRIFGCDDCLAICPWNKFAHNAREARLAVRAELAHLQLADMLQLDEAQWRNLFAKTPVRRAGFDRFMANVFIAMANTGCVPPARIHAWLEMPPAATVPLARAMAVWALRQLESPRQFAALRRHHLPRESHPWVRAEWLAADA